MQRNNVKKILTRMEISRPENNPLSVSFQRTMFEPLRIAQLPSIWIRRLRLSFLAPDNDAQVSSILAFGIPSKANTDISAFRVEIRESEKLLAMRCGGQVLIDDEIPDRLCAGVGAGADGFEKVLILFFS